jgi:predicted MFS family arabinose efflux permease
MRTSHYKWYILALTMLAFGVATGADRYCLPVLFKEISQDLNLSMLSIGTIWGIDPLGGVLISLPAGLLADRFGMKRTLMVACVLAGLFCALRGFSNNFTSLAIITFLFGLTTTFIFTVAPKITAVWFAGKYLGTANALLIVAVSVSSMAATMLSATVISPWLGGWRYTLFFMGAIPIVIAILWLFTGRDPLKDEIPESINRSVPFKQAFTHIIHIREIWIFGLVLVCFMGSVTSSNGYLAIYLRNQGWSAVSADTALTINAATGIVGMLPMMMLANRLKSPYGMLFFSLAMLAVSLVLIPFLDGGWLLAMLIVTGILKAAGPALVNTLILRIKGVGGAYGGTALGLANAIGMIGSFLAPPTGNKMTVFSNGAPFIFWAVLAALSLPLLFYLGYYLPRQVKQVNP